MANSWAASKQACIRQCSTHLSDSKYNTAVQVTQGRALQGWNRLMPSYSALSAAVALPRVH